MYMHVCKLLAIAYIYKAFVLNEARISSLNKTIKFNMVPAVGS